MRLTLIFLMLSGTRGGDSQQRLKPCLIIEMSRMMPYKHDSFKAGNSCELQII